MNNSKDKTVQQFVAWLERDFGAFTNWEDQIKTLCPHHYYLDLPTTAGLNHRLCFSLDREDSYLVYTARAGTAQATILFEGNFDEEAWHAVLGCILGLEVEAWIRQPAPPRTKRKAA